MKYIAVLTATISQSGGCARKVSAVDWSVCCQVVRCPKFYNFIIIWLEARLQNIGFTLRHVLAVLTHSAITPPKVNRFGCNLEHSEYIDGVWPCWIFGAICTVMTAREPGEILFFVRLAMHYLTIGQISQHLNTTCRSVSRWKLLEQNSENFTLCGCLSPEFLMSCDLQAAITPQLLQIAGNSLPK